MRTFFSLWTIFLWILSSDLLAHEVVLPLKPEKLLLDDARLFSADEALQLEAELERFKQLTGIEVHLYAVSFSPLGDIQNLARATIGYWEHQHPSILVAYSRGQDEAYVFPGPKFMDTYPLDYIFHFCQNLNADAKATSGLAKDRMRFMTEQIVSEFTARHALAAKLKAQESRMIQKFMWIGGAGLVLLSALIFLISKTLTPILVEKIQRIEFPKIHMPTRLEAPFGGGRFVSTDTTHKPRDPHVF